MQWVYSVKGFGDVSHQMFISWFVIVRVRHLTVQLLEDFLLIKVVLLSRL